MSSTVGIIGAMDEEIATLLEEIRITEKQEHYGVTYYQGLFDEIPVVLCKSGVGKVNAAITAMTLIQHFQVTSLIFTGVAGALDPNLEIGDIVISKECQYHDMDVTALGYERGIIPYQEESKFPADATLVHWAKAACDQLNNRSVKIGKVLTGDQFISDKKLSSQLYEEMDGVCAEMEGAAVAHVAHVTKTPYVVIRSISDRADKKADVNFQEFTNLASKRSTYVVKQILQQMKQ